MSARLQWKSTSSGEEGLFIVRDRSLRLTAFADGRLDRADESVGDEPGLEIAKPDAEGKLLVTALNGLLLESGGRSFEKVKLPPGGTVSYKVASAVGEITAAAASGGDDPLVGRELGGYEILTRLGNGAMGVVYRARQIALDRVVALKVLNPKAAQAPLAVASFKREAVAAGRLSHPNLVQVYDVGAEQGLQFFAMEMVAGGDLEDRLKESGPLPWEEAVHYIADAAMALSFAQEHHLVHRDVKPENLMLTVDGRVKLADLGMAATRGMVEKDSKGGTPHFLAPECVSGEADHRSDLYSLGCSLYRLLTGRTPYEGSTVKEILRAHRDEDIPSAREHASDVPASVDDLIAWMMAKDPADRPQEATEIVEACEEVLHGTKSKGMILGLAAVALIAVGSAVFFAMRPSPEPSDPEKIFVEVGAEEAEAERQRAEAAERESAYLRALTKPEGEERVAALEKFLEDYPEAEQATAARTELERLRNLPEEGVEGPDPGPNAGDPTSEIAAALHELEAALATDLEAGAFGAAHTRLASSDLGAALLVPLLGDLKSASESAFGAWSGSHAKALDAKDFDAADATVQKFTDSFGSADVPAEWIARRDQLAVAGAEARKAAADAEFRLARLAMLQELQEQALPAVLRLDFTAARTSVASAAAACPHPELRAALEARVPMLEAAERASDAMLSRLDGSGELTIQEPIEDRRAFVLDSNSDGIRVLVQERGERVERVIPWSAFTTPQALESLFEGLAPESLAMSDRMALTTVFGAACTASGIRSWKGLPQSSLAESRAAATRAWLAAIPTASIAGAGSALAAERFQMVQFESFCAALAESNHYLALQRGREAGAQFGLLAAWVSDGDSAWQFQP